MILVEAEADAEPPQNTLRISVSYPVDPDEVIQDITVYRVLDGQRTALRQQPIPGAPVIEAVDYEAPYGEECTYVADLSYSDEGAISEEFEEEWDDLSAWTEGGGAGTYSTSDGLLSFVGAGFTNRTLSRSVTPGRYRFTIWGFSPIASRANATIRFGTVVVDVRNARWRVGDGAWLSLAEWGYGGPAQPLVVELQPGGVAVYQGTIRIGFSNVTPAQVSEVVISASQDPDPVGSVVTGRIVAERFAGLIETRHESYPALLEPKNGWLIHPTRPVRSVELTRGVDISADISPVMNVSTQTTHEVLGATYPVVVSAGPRRSDQWSMGIATDTPDEEAALVTLLEDQTPILLNLPPAWEYGIPHGFYAVGDVTRRRVRQMYGAHDRTIGLPLRQVAAPRGSIVEVQWSYAAVTVDFASYAEMAVAFDSYNALALNRRW